MNDNLNRLSDRINHLENVVTNLTESLPELARQLGSEIRQGNQGLLFIVNFSAIANSQSNSNQLKYEYVHFNAFH